MAKRGEHFKKGKPPGSGIKKGGKKAKTLAWENLGEFITETGAERVAKMLTECNEQDFFKYYCLLLEYFKPKLQRSDVTSTVTNLTAGDVIKELKK